MYESTDNVSKFIGRIRTRHEFARGTNEDKTKYGTYANYVDGMIDKIGGDLTDNEVYTILLKLGLL